MDVDLEAIHEGPGDIGCTTKDLNTTFTHLLAYCKKKRNMSSNVIIEAADAQIEVLEMFEDDIPELRKKLRKIQGRYANSCVIKSNRSKCEK